MGGQKEGRPGHILNNTFIKWRNPLPRRLLLKSHERRSGTYTQDIWKTEGGKTKQHLVRDKPNEKKVTLDYVSLHGFKIEAFYYKDTPDNTWIGIGDKCAILNDYEVKSLFRMFMKVGNRMGIMGKYCNKNKIKLFRKLMKEKTEKEERKHRTWKSRKKEIVKKIEAKEI